MSLLSKSIVASVVAGFLIVGPVGADAQQNSETTEQLTDRLLDAVDGNDINTVRSILAVSSGRTLVTLPVGLTAAGRAIERGYYDVAHHILAVRNQQIQSDSAADTPAPPDQRAFSAGQSHSTHFPAARRNQFGATSAIGNGSTSAAGCGSTCATAYLSAIRPARAGHFAATAPAHRP